jgi:integrase/recombinase XerD
MDVLYGIRMVGPLAPHAGGLASELARLGFTELSARCQLGLASHLSRWLAAAGLGTASLTTSRVEEYLAVRRAAGYTAYLTPKALAPLLGYLRELGVAPQAEIAPPTVPAVVLVERYRCYLLGERGLQARVARGYIDLVRPFVTAHVASGQAGLRELTAGEVTAFLVAESRRLAPKTVQRLATALRSLLRFWHLQGLISGPLDQAVPKVANRRAALPRPLEPAQVEALLASCDRQSAEGRRDLGMLMLLARMGLRAGEVAGLRLDDIDWRRGQITVAGKGKPPRSASLTG